MACQSSETLVVGSLISFKMKSVYTKGCFNGEVYFFNPKTGSFGIQEVSYETICGVYEKTESYHQFTLKEIKDLRVIRLPSPARDTNNTEKDDQKSDPGGDASSK